MYAGLYSGALLSLAPVVLTFRAWQANRLLRPELPRRRGIVFHTGLLASLICAVMSVCGWIVPFPLIPDGHGGYSDAWNSAALLTALTTALLTILSGFFGIRSSRLLLSAAGFIQFVIAYAAMLQNGV